MNFTRYIINIVTCIFISFAACATKAQNQFLEDDFKVLLKTIDNYAVISFKLNNGAVFYWRNPGELGMPTKFNFSKSSNLKDTKIYWPLPDLIKKEDVSSYLYQEDVDFVIKLTPQNFKQNIELNAEISFSICQRSCQNFNVNLSDAVTPNNNTIPGEILEIINKTPKINGTDGLKITNISQELIEDQSWLNVEFIAEKQILEPKIYFDLPEYVHFEPGKYSIISEKNKQIARLAFNIIDSKHHKIDDYVYINLSSDDGNTIEFESIPQKVGATSESFLWILFCAFIGGLILNIMPCVLPILALKSYQLIKLTGQDQLLMRKSFIAQSAGIISCFLIFAFVTYLLQFLGYQVGMGMHFQQPFYLITMAIILSFIAISLITDINFNVVLPDFINRLLSRNSQTTSIISFYISGVFTTLLAIPCTAPFVTIAVGFALTTDLTRMLLIFIFMGIGMSLPFIMFALYPNIARFLPKPGNWMNVFRKIIGVFIFITGLWLIFILTSQLGIRAGVTLFFLIILIKFVITETDILSRKAKAFILVILLTLCYLIPHSIYLENITQETIVEQTWQEYNPEDIPNLIAENYIVVVDVSASWCATCSINKLTTLNNSSVLNTMKKFKLIAMRADISKSTNDKVSSLMRLKNHRGIPLTIIYSKHNPQGVVLPTILTPHIFISAIKTALS